MKQNKFLSLRRLFFLRRVFEIAKNYHWLSQARVTKRMHIFRNITGISEIHLHCYTGHLLSHLLSRQCSDKNQWCLGYIYEKERDLELNWKPYRMNEFSFYWIQRNGENSITQLECWRRQQRECILKGSFVFHLILGYLIKACFDCSRRGYC